jgi:hypothetical protein
MLNVNFGISLDFFSAWVILKKTGILFQRRILVFKQLIIPRNSKTSKFKIVYFVLIFLPQVLKYCHRLFQSTTFNRSLVCDITFSVEGCVMQNVFLGDPEEGKEEVKFFDVPDLKERDFVEQVGA